MRIVSKQPSERAPARMGRLAVLPIFLTLEGKRAVVIGGTAAAAWKAELLAAAGANVAVYAPLGQRSAELSSLPEATIEIIDRSWSREAVADAAIVVADVADMAEGQAIADAACQAGIPVNIIDRPTLSQFQFGSIVNRSPVVIGISTAGAMPILAQAIRQRLESMLPASLAAWAALAQRLRPSIGAMLSSKAARRSFWKNLATHAFGPPPAVDAEQTLLETATRIRSSLSEGSGRVTLVGAGPGDAELLTLKALRALQAADVILFDDLVSDQVLELARREARRMLVGKRGGRDSCRQEDINELMVKLAKAGKHVVRLKSGDPMIFGRGGEEISRLEAAGIPVDIVPGITAALAMAAALGVSLTHRDHAQSVRFVTGHARDGKLPADLDWQSMAGSAATTIFYMGGGTAGQIAARLIMEGLSPNTPVAVAASISRPDERLLRGLLSDLAELAKAVGTTGPVLVGVGRSFATASAAATTTPCHAGAENLALDA